MSIWECITLKIRRAHAQIVLMHDTLQAVVELRCCRTSARGSSIPLPSPHYQQLTDLHAARPRHNKPVLFCAITKSLK